MFIVFFLSIFLRWYSYN